ncbi:GAF domain-containing protein [Paenibacillus psychroresistens]|uniref:GAF domain-containing protein n=1 Tax=Paenibacillus psychroresistens TaxID=1778678 RepID=A0A6B8RLN6_9BACL|nr:GAF domain-containing protein [Paenibacillus psychroresistens]QGQ96757.1 GAF domain-containing protein [Paenibacillus psychroresistens]
MLESSRYYKLAERINSKLDLREALEQVVVAISEEIVRCDAVGIYLPKPDGTFQGYIGKPDRLNGLMLDQLNVDPKNDMLAQEIITFKKSIYIPDTSVDQRPDPKIVQFFQIKSLLALPITYEEEIFGIVYLFDYGIAMNLSIEEIQTVEAYVNMAAVVIRNTKIFAGFQNIEKELMLAKKELQLNLLTPVEREVYELKQQGLNKTEIAKHLQKSLNTVKNQWKNVREKLGL